jgi:hypothetical protein
MGDTPKRCCSCCRDDHLHKSLAQPDSYEHGRQCGPQHLDIGGEKETQISKTGTSITYYDFSVSATLEKLDHQKVQATASC